jgi:hypothetical protein
MFLFAKLALVTCGFYMLAAILLEFAVLVLMHMKGGIFFFGISYRVWAGAFCVLWFISFSLAWRIVMSPLRTGFHG